MTISEKKRANKLAELQQEFAEEGAKNATKKDIPKNKKVNISFYANPNLHKELKIIAANEDSNINALLLEGISLLLSNRGKSINDYL